MKLQRAAAMSVAVVATVGMVGAGTAYASPPPTPDATVQHLPDTAGVVPQDVYSQPAYQNMITQIEKGWFNGGAQVAGIGAGVGAVVGCVLFLFVGCIPGAAIGAAIGAANGVTNANPDAAPAVFDFVKTLP
ncbi:hypothetical protein [Rhodococcus kronopolitis]|uniref:Glycine zipper family protein n=1 Tax=Rhodococcus kronopolitis TaxID=1460226 RepID=A0ABV9FR47_9NOCA